MELPAVIARRHGDNALVSSTETAFAFDGSMSLKDFYFRAQIPVVRKKNSKIGDVESHFRS